MQLEIEKLSKTYSNGVEALKDVNLTIKSGMFGLLGPNGAGKSTLMRTIAGLQEADNGSIYFNGFDVVSQKHELRKVLGYLPQEFGLYPKVSAEYILDHFAAIKGITDKKQRNLLVENLLKKTNLFEMRRNKLGSFSGGMKQRFGIALALIGDPKIIIVDEPTAGLDPAERNRFLNLLSEIGENVVVILSTHIVNDVSDLCKDMAIINKGQVLLKGEPLSLINELDGKIWEKTISKSEFGSYNEIYKVLSTRLFAGNTIIRIISDNDPMNGFAKVEPDLEDVYFSTLK